MIDEDLAIEIAAEEHRQGAPYVASAHCKACEGVDKAQQQAMCDHDFDDPNQFKRLDGTVWIQESALPCWYCGISKGEADRLSKTKKEVAIWMV